MAARAGSLNTIPSGWNDVVFRGILVGVTTFATLVIKEYMETKELDLKACSVDATWIMGATLVLFGLLRVLAPKR
jgi:hypothetical protein